MKRRVEFTRIYEQNLRSVEPVVVNIRGARKNIPVENIKFVKEIRRQNYKYFVINVCGVEGIVFMVVFRLLTLAPLYLLSRA